nr:DUF4153 domain-containing protein [Propylenella binzhouense]
MIAPLAVAGALFLLVPLAAYSGARSAGFWAFVWRLINVSALALVTVAVFLAGVSAILASVEYLFEVDLPGDTYGHIWVTGLGFVGPLFALSQIPRTMPDTDSVDPGDLIVAGIAVLSDFVAVPLLVAYALLLHVYGLKILLTGELPKNQIGWMVLSFGSAVLLLRLAADPFEAFARASTRLFLRCWPVILPGPLLLLAYAVSVRIGSAGMTPRRYALALFALFLVIVLAAQAFRRLRRDIRVIPAAAALLLLLGSFGPWGMIATTVGSQTERLAAVLARSAASGEGGVATGAPLDRAAAAEVRSILSLLDEVGRLDAVASLAPDIVPALGLPERRDRLERVAAALGAAPVQVTSPAGLSYSADQSARGPVSVAGYDIVVPWLEWGMSAPAVAIAVAGRELQVRTEEGGLVFEQDGASLRIAEADIVAALANRAVPGPLFLEHDLGGRRIGMLFETVASPGPGGNGLAGRFLLFLRAGDWTGPL